MGFGIREVEAESKFSSQLSLDAISRAVPPDSIEAVLTEQDAKEQCERRLNAFAVVLLVIAMNIFSQLSIPRVLKKIAQGLRYIWPDPDYQVAGRGAISYRRYQLGARPLAAPFRCICRPLATPDTPGAYLYGRRLMAIDGTVEDLADTPENVAAYGAITAIVARRPSPRSAQCTLQCGTHAIVDAGSWPTHTSERKGAFRMLRSIEAGMLVMVDADLY